ncbi:fibronectin type iii [Lucifera butyrica]|uniref:Fibronectin type iii n=1 Tax=Lucifera butyrica TaxID=1351585 RepID=A0A498RDJ6_9FIRM|nr:LamG-like jellyroll fold domain-containing protein [Lucifera butyrica]VBB08143.1 fibronectin type iii [Lucifera butyrica]
MYQVDQNTLALLHFEDGVKDECGNDWIIQNNGVSISQAQVKDGDGSAYFNAIGGMYTDAASKFVFDTGDFTIDFWLYYIQGNYEASFGNVVLLLDSRESANSEQPIYITLDSNYKLAFSIEDKVLTSSAGALKPNEWIHITCVRNTGTGYIFVNGEIVASGDLNAGINKSFPIYLGGDSYTRTSIGAIEAYLDEFRISNIARWTSNFAPSAPTNLSATAGDSKVTLSWDAVTDAVSYNVKRSTTAGGPYTTIASGVIGTSYVDTDVVNGTTYYYVVTAVIENGIESDNSNEASATPVAASRALLRVTMSDSSEREYKLTTTEINNFVQWYNRTVGTGNTCYTFDDIINGSKEYLAFEKIISFKVVPIAQ